MTLHMPYRSITIDQTEEDTDTIKFNAFALMKMCSDTGKKYAVMMAYSDMLIATDFYPEDPSGKLGLPDEYFCK